jgi:uncharacterized RDD family membrane protein YckC
MDWSDFAGLAFMNSEGTGQGRVESIEDGPRQDSGVGSQSAPVVAASTVGADSEAVSDSTAASASKEVDASAWRDELSLRLNRYRARRKMRPPRYPSLSLRFDAVQSLGSANSVPAVSDPHDFAPISDHALALDGMMQHPSATAETDERVRQEPVRASAPLGAGVLAPATTLIAKTAKIIEFPRFAWGPPSPPPDQLAEPVSDRPRILEAPEIVPPAPALGGITIEATEPREAEKRPGIDIPLQSASLARRVAASGVDGVIVALASGLFGFIFWKVAAVRPPLLQVLGLAAGIPCLFWAAYQYLLIVYTASTPGLRAAGLELARFDGTSTNRRLRRWRVLAACLSGVSLGMGYVWVFLDEDALCWHDRITHTYVAPGKPHAKPGHE